MITAVGLGTTIFGKKVTILLAPGAGFGLSRGWRWGMTNVMFFLTAIMQHGKMYLLTTNIGFNGVSAHFWDKIQGE
ncbi:MAG: hypothetical protein H6995_04455 [Pseudomonadales bacterium]|nr:hypothetical protein [Pseudomonadales bacterium]